MRFLRHIVPIILFSILCSLKLKRLRILPVVDLDAEIQLDSWTPPPLWKLIQSEGQIATDEMYRVFNMGIGIIIIVDKDSVAEVQKLISEPTFVIGQLVKGEKKVRLIQ